MNHYLPAVIQLEKLQSLLIKQRIRVPLIVSHFSDKERAVFQNIFCERFSHQSILIMNNFGVKESESNNLIPVKTQLGKEWHHVVYDASESLSLNALASISGVILAGGFFIILAPEIEMWPSLQDHESLRLFGDKLDNNSLCILRLLQYSEQWILPIGNESEMCFRLEQIFQTLKNIPIQTGATNLSVDNRTSMFEFPEQKSAVDQIKKVALGHAKRPFVLTADRGRGKSTALGLAAAELVNEFDKTIWVTGPRQDSILSLKYWFNQTVMPERVSRLKYFAPDELYRQLQDSRNDCDIILVDEAAAIPSDLLQQMLEHHNRWVFASTIHGYEGTGMGFEIRFKGALKRKFPQWRSLHIHQPIRWSDNDPLEHWTDQCCLLKSSTPVEEIKASDSPSQQTKGNGSSDIDWITVLDNPVAIPESILQSVFRLLVDSHYQTTPDDLRLLMDHPHRKLVVMIKEGVVIGACLAIEEQSISPELTSDINEGSRRIRGNLTQQSMIFHLGHLSPPSPIWRIQRIVVDAQFRRQGFGAIIVGKIECLAQVKGVKALSTSFAASPDVVPFWLGLKFHPLRIGLSKDKSSGCHSLLMLKEIQSVESLDLHQIYRQFFTRTRLLLPSTLRDLNPSVVQQLYSSQCVEDVVVDRHLIESCLHFSRGRRHLDDAILELNALLMIVLRKGVLTSEEQMQIIAKLWMCFDWREWAKLTKCNGKKQAEKEFKRLISQAALRLNALQ